MRCYVFEWGAQLEQRYSTLSPMDESVRTLMSFLPSELRKTFIDARELAGNMS